MTLIIGFPVASHVVLGADGEEGGAIEKAAVRKIATINGSDYRCLIGGAGHGDFIDLAVQHMLQHLARRGATDDAPTTLAYLRDTLEDIVTAIYDERIDALTPSQQKYAEFVLLCALWTKEEGIAQLVRVGRRYCLIRTNPDVAGIGSYLARYLIETLHMPGMQRRHGERLGAYILAKAKAHVKDCGGLSQIVVLDAQGNVMDVPQFVITEDEASAALIMDEGVRGLFHWADIIGWQGNIDKIGEVIDQITASLKRQLRLRFIRRQAADAAEHQAMQPTPTVPKDDPKDPPPSPA
jgi:hypothetical protein